MPGDEVPVAAAVGDSGDSAAATACDKEDNTRPNSYLNIWVSTTDADSDEAEAKRLKLICSRGRDNHLEYSAD